MNFYDLSAKLRAIEESSVPECGDMMPMPMMSHAPQQQDSVTMNVSMNGSGAGGIKDLMSILRNIEQSAEHDHAEPMIAQPHGMDGDVDIVLGTADEDMLTNADADESELIVGVVIVGLVPNTTAPVPVEVVTPVPPEVTGRALVNVTTCAVLMLNAVVVPLVASCNTPEVSPLMFRAVPLVVPELMMDAIIDSPLLALAYCLQPPTLKRLGSRCCLGH